MHDPVTGVLNRWSFIDWLHSELSQSIDDTIPGAMLMIEVNNFQHINLHHNFLMGDRVLQQLSDILRQVARSKDKVARIGDSRFAVYLKNINDIQHARLAAYKILRLVEEHSLLEDHTVPYSISTSIGLYPSNALTAEDLMREAEIALKHAGLNQHKIGIADQKYRDKLLDDINLERDLQHSINNNELVLFFQPKINSISGLPTGAEALIRWQHPKWGLLTPDKFLSVAETSGFMKPMTRWVMNSALRLSKEWTAQWGPLTVSINIPPKCLEQESFAEEVKNALGLWERDGKDLCIEILESSFFSEQINSPVNIKKLKGHGVKISIDDFGTGYSSLSYFRNIPADELKIDQSFIRDLLEDEANMNIVSLIIDLAHSFGLSVVAEGVETKEHADQLQKKGCDQLQGYHYSRPMPSEDFINWLLNFCRK